MSALPLLIRRGLKSGSDGARTRDLRRDRPAFTAGNVDVNAREGFGDRREVPMLLRTSSPRSVAELQAFCKHPPSAGRRLIPPKRNGEGHIWLGACISAEDGGTRVHSRGGS
jgi:hypothetical protein